MAACLLGRGIAADNSPDAGLVRFVAYNLHNYSLQSSTERNASPPKSEREILQMLKILAELKPDILGVCEMGSEEDLADFQRRLEAVGLPMPHREWVQGADPSRHLALLSRFPIIARQSRTDLRYPLDQVMRPIQRGILDVTVQIETNYSLRLLGLHLKSRREVEDAEQALMRRHEAHLVRQQINEILISAPATNLLVYGDCNESKEEPGLREIKGAPGQPNALRELPLADDAGEKWTYYYEPADEYSRIDFAFASAGLMPEVALKRSGIYPGRDWNEASDHRPLFIALKPADRNTP